MFDNISSNKSLDSDIDGYYNRLCKYISTNNIESGIFYEVFRKISIDAGYQEIDISAVAAKHNISKNSDGYNDSLLILEVYKSIFDNLLKPSLKYVPGFIPIHDLIFNLSSGFVIDQIKMSKENLIKAAIAASIVLVVIAFLYRGKKTNNKPQSQITQEDSDTENRSDSREVSLCLILKSEYLGDLLASRNVDITSTRLKELIDRANYFLCVDIGNVSNLENKWSIAQVSEPDNGDEDADVYVRVNITNGQEMIDATYPYALSEGILPNSKVKLEKISYLRNMSLIYDFRRP